MRAWAIKVNGTVDVRTVSATQHEAIAIYSYFHHIDGGENETFLSKLFENFKDHLRESGTVIDIVPVEVTEV